MQASTLNKIAARYGITASELTSQSGGHTALVYRYNFRGRDYILRIIPPNEEITFRSTRLILEWLAFLARRGGPVSKPVRSLKGNLIEQVQSAGQLYLVTAFEKAPGVLAERMQPEQWSDELFQSLGRAIGSCHRIACQYAPPEKISHLSGNRLVIASIHLRIWMASIPISWKNAVRSWMQSLICR